MRLVSSFAFPVFDLSSAIGYLWLSHLSLFSCKQRKCKQKEEKMHSFWLLGTVRVIQCFVVHQTDELQLRHNIRTCAAYICMSIFILLFACISQSQVFHTVFPARHPTPSWGRAFGGGVPPPPSPPGEMGCSGRKDAGAERGRGGHARGGRRGGVLPLSATCCL